LQPLRNRVKKLESELETLHRRKEALDEKLADPTLYDGSQIERQKTLTMESRLLVQQIDETESQWLMVCEELEIAETSD